MSYDTLIPKEFLAPSWHQVQDLLFRVILFGMIFVYPEEEIAIQNLALRLEEESGIYDGWSRWTVLNPSFFKGEESLPRTPFERPRRNEIFTELDAWRSFRNLLRHHHSFITPSFESDVALCGLGKQIERSGAKLGFKTRQGRAFSNYFNEKTNRRSIRESPLYELSKEGVWCQLIEEPSCLKILGILNTGRPKNLQNFVSCLMSLAIGELGFKMIYGHPMMVPNEDRYPHNGSTDKRFKKWKNGKLEMDGETKSFVLNRLFKFWLLMGFNLLWSPDEGKELCVGALSSEYRKTLLTHDKEAWNQIFEGPITQL